MVESDLIPGIKCPNCNNFVPILINQILFSDYLFCPTCGLKITINEQKGA